LKQKASIRGQLLTEVLERVAQFANTWDRSSVPKSTFFLVAPPYLIRLNRLFGERQAFKHLVAMYRFGIHRCLILAPFRFEKIQIKNNIRIFGLDQKASKTAKLQGQNGLQRRDSVACEIRTRKWLTKFKPFLPIHIPEILSCQEASGWLVEECLNGKKPVLPEDRNILENFLCDDLVSYYQIFLHHRTVRETLAEMGLDEQTLSQYWPPDKGTLLKKSLELSWGLSFCHNDLSRGNMMLVNDEIFLIDWEHAGDNPICFDYEGIMKKNPLLKRACLAALTKLGGGDGTSQQVTPRVQLALAAAVRCVRIEQNSTNKIQYLLMKTHINMATAKQRVERDFRNEMEIIRSLLAEEEDCNFQ